MNCPGGCSPWTLVYDTEHVWCEVCGRQWYLARAGGRLLGWRPSDYRRTVCHG